MRYWWTRRSPLTHPDLAQATSQRLLTQATIVSTVVMIHVPPAKLLLLPQSIFLGAVHAQALAIYLNPNVTSVLQTATNAFTFAGIFLDVIAGFTSLLSSVMIATRVANVTLLHSIVSKCSRRYLDDAMRTNVITELGRMRSPIGRWMLWQITMFREQQTYDTATNPETVTADGIIARHMRVDAQDLIRRVDQLGGSIDMLMFAGDVAMLVTLLGILCFSSSIILFAFSQQPRGVQIVSVIVASTFGWVGVITLIRPVLRMSNGLILVLN